MARTAIRQLDIDNINIQATRRLGIYADGFMSLHFIVGGALTYFVIALYGGRLIHALVSACVIAYCFSIFFLSAKQLAKQNLRLVVLSTPEVSLYLFVGLLCTATKAGAALFFVLGLCSMYLYFRRFKQQRESWRRAFFFQYAREYVLERKKLRLLANPSMHRTLRDKSAQRL